MMESGQMLEDWDELMQMEVPKPLREYMDCLFLSSTSTSSSSSSSASSSSYLVVDDAPTGRVTLDIDCLLQRVPELPPPISSSSSFPRSATERLPSLLNPLEYACVKGGGGGMVCEGRAAPLLLEAAFTRHEANHLPPPSEDGRGGGGGEGELTYSDAQLDMQDDFADLCAFYPNLQDGEVRLVTHPSTHPFFHPHTHSSIHI